MDTRLLRNRPAFTLDRKTAPAMWLVETLWLFLATGVQTSNRCSVLEQVMHRGLGPPTHKHPLAIEGFYVLEGVVRFHVDGKFVHAEAGTLIHLPAMTPHTFTVESEETRVLNFYAPAGVELHVMALARPAGERRRPTMEEGPPPQNAEENRILTKLYGTAAVTVLPFSVPPSEPLLVTKQGAWGAGAIHVGRPSGASEYDAFGFRWRLLAAAADTGGLYDLFDVMAADNAAMPARILGADEAIYVIEGALTVDSDGQSTEAAGGSFTYAQAGSVMGWRAAAGSRLLVFHLPGGFDRALAGGRGQDALVAAWLESTGTRFLAALPLPDAAMDGTGR